jgi:hypothetical protein
MTKRASCVERANFSVLSQSVNLFPQGPARTHRGPNPRAGGRAPGGGGGGMSLLGRRRQLCRDGALDGGERRFGLCRRGAAGLRHVGPAAAAFAA